MEEITRRVKRPAATKVPSLKNEIDNWARSDEKNINQI